MKQLIYIIIASTLTTTIAFGQVIDADKMQRDIEVAENILATLLNQNGRDVQSFYGRSPFKGTYIKDYGVIFGAPRGLPTVFVSYGKGTTSNSYELTETGGSATIVRASGDKKDIDKDSLNNEINKKWIENAQTFLVDYAHLIGQLKSDDKIVVTNGPAGFGNRQFFMRTNVSRTSVEVLKKDLDAYHSGKMSRDQLIKAIKVTSNESVKAEKDVELLASIFEALYKQNLSETYYVSGGIYTESIPDLGVILQMNVYSSISERDGLHRIVTQDLTGLTQEERDKRVKDMYPEFLEDLKKNIVLYGRTVKSIKAGEQLIFNVQLTKCRGCGIPGRLELTIKGADLSAFNEGKISESTAIDRINVNASDEQ